MGMGGYFLIGYANGKLRNLHIMTLVKSVVSALFLPLSVFYMEILAKLSLFGSLSDGKLHYLVMLSLAMAFLLSFVAMLFKGKGRRRFCIAVLAFLAVWFSFHLSYYGNFHTFFSWQTLGQAKDITQFWREAIVAALNVWYLILAFFVPMFIMCAIGVLIFPDDTPRSMPLAALSLAAFAGLYIPAVLDISGTKAMTSDYSPYYYYTYLQNDLETSFRYFGVINTTRLDVKQLIFGAPVEQIEVDSLDFESPDTGDVTVSDSDTVKEYGYNVMEIDFDKAADSTKSKKLKAMDGYFKSVPPTRQNEYTGLFKGKNLIFLTLEGYCDKVIDPEVTPILYRMSTEGFVFRNFYNSIWGGSTASGEYANMTGNFYLNASCLKKSGSTYQPFALGNQLAGQGYVTYAYHNNTYTYYSRNLSHPNFGYKWKAVGNGLKLKSKCWPASDKELAEATVGEYVNSDVPFHAYYMTVSGHANYTFAGNMMSVRHMNDLSMAQKKLPLEDRAYLACQYEVELMMRVLLDELEKAGKLQDTVFVMAADHYPYALSDKALSVLYKLPKAGIRKNFDLYRNGLIIWCPSMTEPVVVETPCSTIDILPTVSNLFGLEYDSRLMMGSDIMAPGDHFALLKVSGWSWISQEGTYRAASKKFIPSSECTLTAKEQESYIKRINKIVRAKTTYSMQILDNNYYAHIFKK